MSAQSNDVHIKNGIIYVILHGKQDKWTVQSTVTKTLEQIETLKSQEAPLRCLVDVSDDVGYDIGARGAAVEAMKKYAMTTAIVGANTALKAVVNFMTKMAGQGDKFRAFETMGEAEAWLNSF